MINIYGKYQNRYSIVWDELFPPDSQIRKYLYNLVTIEDLGYYRYIGIRYMIRNKIENYFK